MNYKMKFRNFLALCFAVAVVSMSASSVAQAAGYTYTSKEYGYTIECPQKPVGVIPLSALSPEEKGDVLVFANDGYNIKHAWVIMPNGFDQDSLPDLDKISEADAKTLFGKLMATGYEFASLVNVNGHNALYAVTSKTMLVGKDSEGKPEKVEADAQQVKTFIRGKNDRYAVILMDNPTLLKEDIQSYQDGVLSFKEINKK